MSWFTSNKLLHKVILMIKSRISNGFHRLQYFFQDYPLGFPILLFVLALGTYGVFIFSLGFYWDDWPPILLSHIKDKATIWQYWSYDRPFQSWTYYLLFPICRDSTIAWQLSAIIFRWSSGLFLYLTLLRLFPTQRSFLQWATILFVVFPGFSNQYSSVSFGSHFITYTAYGFSLYMMVLAFQKKKYFWLFFPISIFFQAVQLFTMEYFVGLEALRPVILWLVLNRSKEKTLGKIKNVLIYWLPYLAMLGFYLVWRLKIYPQSSGGGLGDNYPYLFMDIFKTPVETLLSFFQIVYRDLKFVLINMWTDRLLPDDWDFKRMIFWFSLVVGILLIWIIQKLLFNEQQSSSYPITKDNTRVNLVLSLVIIICGSFPVWSTLREISGGKWSDRFVLPVMFGVTLLIATFLFAAIKEYRLRTAILVLMTGLSIGYQIRLGNDFQDDFSRQQQFYAQLKWRIPYLEPGTAVYSPGIPTTKEADYSYTMGINLLYSSDEVTSDFDYWFTGPRYVNPSTLLADPNYIIKHELRIYKFEGTSSRILAIHYPSTGCLWVIDPYYSLLSTGISDFPLYGQLTNQALIIDNEEKVNGLSKIIDFDAQKNWCFYFQKGDLAQSKGQYEKSIAYYEEAMSKGLIPYEAIEYLPFIKAYTHLGRIDDAVVLTQKSFNKSSLTKPVLCQYWNDRLSENASSIASSNLDNVYNENNCPSFFTGD